MGQRFRHQKCWPRARLRYIMDSHRETGIGTLLCRRTWWHRYFNRHFLTCSITFSYSPLHMWTPLSRENVDAQSTNRQVPNGQYSGYRRFDQRRRGSFPPPWSNCPFDLSNSDRRTRRSIVLQHNDAESIGAKAHTHASHRVG